MKTCPYCGKQYPDAATVCEVDAQTLVTSGSNDAEHTSHSSPVFRMKRLQRSWWLFKQSLVIFRQHKKLLVFPALLILMVVLIATLFLGPLSLAPSNTRWVSLAPAHTAALTDEKAPAAYTTDRLGRRHYRSNLRLSPLLAGDLVLVYLALMFVATFPNVAFYREILNALEGNPVSVRDGLRFACRQWKIILKWALFAGVVGLFIKLLVNRFGIIGRLVIRLTDVAWSIACVFVIPVLVAHEKEKDPMLLVEKSASLLKKTWGEGLIAFVGVAIGETFLLLAFLVALCVATDLALKFGSFWVFVILVGVCLIVVAALEYLVSVLNAIYICALYLYASHGTVVQPYTKDILRGAWKTKTTR